MNKIKKAAHYRRLNSSNLIDLALDLGLLHMLRLAALRGKSFLAN